MPARRKRRHLGVVGYLGLAMLFVVLLLAPTYALWGGHAYPAWLGACSLVTFGMYLVDKRAAPQPDASRIPESALHTMALAGGFVGGLVGRHALRHKTRKPAFALVLLLAAALHLVGATLLGAF